MLKKMPFCVFNMDNPQFFNQSIIKSLKLALNYHKIPFFYLFKAFHSYPDKSKAAHFMSNFFETSQKINSSQIIFHYDPLIPLIRSYQSKNIVLLCGDEFRIHLIASEMQYQNYLTMGEYCNLFPKLVPISKRTNLLIETTKQTVLSRMPFLNSKDFEYPFQINSVFFLEEVRDWEEYGQVITDLLSTKDGKIANKFDEFHGNEHIPIFYSSSELYALDINGNQVLGMGGLMEAIKTCYGLIYKKELQFNMDKKEPEKEILSFLGNLYIF